MSIFEKYEAFNICNVHHKNTKLNEHLCFWNKTGIISSLYIPITPHIPLLLPENTVNSFHCISTYTWYSSWWSVKVLSRKLYPVSIFQFINCIFKLWVKGYISDFVDILMYTYDNNKFSGKICMSYNGQKCPT